MDPRDLPEGHRDGVAPIAVTNCNANHVGRCRPAYGTTEEKMILDSNTNFADQINCAIAGTAVPGPAGVSSDDGFMLSSHPDNVDAIWIFENGPGKTKNHGYPLLVGASVIVSVVNLDQLQFESATAAQKVCWIKF
jgi:hypothetical protein